MAMNRRPMTIDDNWALPRVGLPEPSPDGREFIVPVTTYSMETNEGTTRLWKIPSNATKAGDGKKGDPARVLTTADASSGQPAYSPDGTLLLFVRKPGGNKDGKKGGNRPNYPDVPQLYLMPMKGGEPERLTDLPLGVTNPRWFPDGKRIAFFTGLYKDALTIEGTAKLKQERDEDPVKARVTEDRVYRFWDTWLTDGKVHHIFVMDIASREMMDITADSKRWIDFMDMTDQFSISPDGKEIAFDACRTKPPYDRLVWGVFTVGVPDKISPKAQRGKTVWLTTHHKTNAFLPKYSPDGRYIVYGIQRELDFYADRVRLVAYDRRNGTHTVLTESWDRSAAGWTFGADPGRVYVMAEHFSRTAIFALNLQAALKKPEGYAPRELIRGGTYSKPRVVNNRVFLQHSSLTSPPEIFSFALRDKDLIQNTGFTDPIMREIQLGAVKEMIFDGAEGHPVQMLVLHPPRKTGKGAAKKVKKKYPLVQLVHGGPHGIFGDNWHWRWNAQLFASPGYVVAMVNFHGSSSWGQDFAASILGRWGDQPFHDVMIGTDHLVDSGLVDDKRIAVAGGSYGGYLVSWIASQTDRYACIINHAGVCDFQTQYASDVTQGRARSMGGEPWKNITAMDQYNPVRQAKGFKSPMLVIHGELDYRVPYVQGLEIYNIYKAMKLPARLVIYPDENHWILKPKNSVHWYGEVLDWLNRWIGKGAKK
ncbi:S9 family peptidase [Acidobacteriota bacterium]